MLKQLRPSPLDQAAGGASRAPGSIELSVRSVSKAFAGVRAVRDVSFEVKTAEIVGLIGPNGAGKTTLFNCLTGFMLVDSGEVWFRDVRIDHWRPHRIARLGVVRTFQNIRMFPDLTPLESLLVAQYTQHRAGFASAVLSLPSHRSAMRTMHDRAEEILQLLGLDGVARKTCKELTLLEQRKLELGRAMAANPRLLLLDEVSAGATAAESAELMEVIRGIHAKGTAILLIEHNVKFVMGLAHRVAVLNFGELVASGTPIEIQGNELVRQIYLG